MDQLLTTGRSAALDGSLQDPTLARKPWTEVHIYKLAWPLDAHVRLTPRPHGKEIYFNVLFELFSRRLGNAVAEEIGGCRGKRPAQSSIMHANYAVGRNENWYFSLHTAMSPEGDPTMAPLALKNLLIGMLPFLYTYRVVEFDFELLRWRSSTKNWFSEAHGAIARGYPKV